MTKHILVSVDLTHADDAAKLLREADRVAKTDDATLSVITVVPDYGTSFVASFFPDGTLQKAIEATDTSLHAFVAEKLPDRTDVQHITEVGVTYERVLERASQIPADLIIVGAHKPDLGDRLLGPNAGRIARQARCSVMIVRF
ncbi:MAG: universal stress protein [Pseudomonadota bacterium]